MVVSGSNNPRFSLPLFESGRLPFGPLLFTLPLHDLNTNTAEEFTTGEAQTRGSMHDPSFSLYSSLLDLCSLNACFNVSAAPFLLLLSFPCSLLPLAPPSISLRPDDIAFTAILSNHTHSRPNQSSKLERTIRMYSSTMFARSQLTQWYV